MKSTQATQATPAVNSTLATEQTLTPAASTIGAGRHCRRAAFGAFAGMSLVVLAALVAASAGCTGNSDANASSGKRESTTESSPSSEGKTAAAAKETRSAQQVLEDMETAYRTAKAYGDKARLHRYFKRNGETLEQLFLAELAFQRPNMLRLDCYDARVVCDGKHFYATAPQVPNVVLQVPAPNKLAPGDMVRDPQLGKALFETPAGPPLTLSMLIQDRPFGEMLREAMAPPKLLEPETFEGHRCNRLELDTSYGKLMFWIDAESNLLRRLDFPPAFAKQWEQPQEQTTGLTAVFTDAQFNPQFPPETFRFEIPEGAQVADSLVPVFEATPASARTEPAKLKLTKLWTASEVKNPGNVMLVEDGGNRRVLVIDGARTVVELDENGAIKDRHDLQLPPEAIVTFLRTAVDGSGKRHYIGSANGQPQVHVFDEAWQRVLSYPDAEDAGAAQLSNAFVADLAGDGKPQVCLGFWGDLGVHGIALDGKPLWKEASPLDVQPTTATEADGEGKRRLLCTHRGGTVVILDSNGKPTAEVEVPNRIIAQVVGADVDQSGKNSYCALGFSQDQANVALGLALEGSEQWLYDLPDGAPGRPVEMLSTADLDGDGKLEWLVAAPDSSIHILKADGTLLDKFNHGAALCGLAGAKFDGKPVLLISSVRTEPDGDSHSVLEAWQVETP